MFIELHMIQNFSPSNLNRDDTGSPKSCEFGGHRRARISSQSLKRAIRRHPSFADKVGVPIGERTKWITRSIAETLVKEGKGESDSLVVATAFARFYAGKKGKMDTKNEQKTNVLLYLSKNEISIIVEHALANWDVVLKEATDKTPKYEEIKTIVNKHIIPRVKNRTHAPDIALFGRMLADQPDLGIDAASQVSHAISTHRVAMEMDYFTAVDDLQKDIEPGAGMVGFTSFNSACFYRYMRIDWDLLVKNLDGDLEIAQKTVEGFLYSSTEAIPTGKQNAFAAQNPTSFALATVRADGKSWNLANAFETPIRANRDTGYVAPSIQKLDEYWGKLFDFYDDTEIKAMAVQTLDHVDSLDHLQLHRVAKMSEWVRKITAALTVQES